MIIGRNSTEDGIVFPISDAANEMAVEFPSCLRTLPNVNLFAWELKLVANIKRR